MKTFSCILLYCILLISCNSSLEKPYSVNPDEIMLFSLEGPSPLDWNKRDSTKLIVRLPKTAGQLDVNFKTTLGKFRRTSATEISQYADIMIDDNYRYAVVYLSATDTAGVAQITASVTGQRRTSSIQITR